MHALFREFFFPILALQKLLKSVKIWQSYSQMYTATFYMNHGKNVGFNCSMYGAHINRVMW